MGLKRRVVAAAAIITCGAAIAQAQVHAPPITISAEQVARGQQVYQASCQSCHGGTLAGGPGGPALVGSAFRARWRTQASDALYTYIRERMPPMAGRSLPDAAYAAVTARILEANGVKTGDAPMPADAAKLAGLSLDAALPVDKGARQEVKPRPVALEPDAVAVQVTRQRADQLAKLRPVTDDMLRNPPSGAWLQWRNTYDNHGFSTLDQVNRENVAGLQLAWSWEMGASSNEIAPLMHDGVIFAAGGGRLQAIDASSGDLLWQYTRPEASGVIRTIAIYGGLVYYSAGVEVQAIDIHDGRLVWKTALASPKDGLYISTGPLVAKGKVYQGMGGCSAPYEGGCFVAALDAETGREVWRFRTIAKPGEPGGDSWNGAPLDQRFGASVWNPPTYDPALDLLFVGTGQTYHTTPLLQGKLGAKGASDGLYTNSTLALRPDTGELVWYYQHMARDIWDLDWSYERTMAIQTIDGKPLRTVTTIGKLGIADTLDAATGRYIKSFQTGPQTLVKSIDPVTGAKTIAAGFTPVPDVEKTVCPSAFGGRNWPSTAFNPDSGVLFVPLNENCMAHKWTPGPIFDIGFRVIRTPGSDGMVGRVQAVDMASGKTLWTRRERAPHTSAVLATAGGLIFEGTRDRWFRASDQQTGKVLWQVRLDGAINSFPITYSVNGIQYVAVTTGGTAPLEMFIAPLAPEIQTTSSATTLWTFRLPKLS